MSAVAWSTLGPAMLAWIRSCTGLDTSHVVWAQGTKRPTGTYISARIASISSVEGDWQDVEIDEDTGVTTSYTRGHRKIVLSIQCIAGSGLPFGDAAPAMILHELVSRSNLQSVHDALDAANLGLSDLGTVQAIDGFVNSSVFEPRATIEATFYVMSEIVETEADGIGIIETTEITGLLPGDPDEPVDRVIIMTVSTED